MAKEICIICGNQAEDGLMVRGKLICQQCESKIVQITVDSSSYNDIKQRIKQIWKDDVAIDI